MTDFHDKPYHSKSDLLGDPNKPQEGSRKTSFAFVSDIQLMKQHVSQNEQITRYSLKTDLQKDASFYVFSPNFSGR